MTAQILHGQKIAKAIRIQLANEISSRTKKGLRSPGLAVILVGDDHASKIYVKNKRQACHEIGIISTAYDLDASIEQEVLLALIDSFNRDKEIDGILVQLPLPKHLDQKEILERINPQKDVDGFHPFNVGRLIQGHPFLYPCTPHGIMTLLRTTKVNLLGLNATVVGTSNIVGKPMIFELLTAGLTVTACHIHTKDLATHVKSADVLIAATGKPLLIKGDWIKPGAIVIDVGINHLANGELVGDVDFDAAKEHAGWITPVPGGVGPMTIAALLQNTLFANKTFSIN